MIEPVADKTFHLYIFPMKFFSLKEQVLALRSPEVESLVYRVEALRTKAAPFLTDAKKEQAKREHIIASNAIEGIMITDSRAEDILVNGLKPQTNEEKLILGYRAGLNRVLDEYPYVSLTESYICDLHACLYSELHPGFGGRYKTEQNYIAKEGGDGGFHAVFVPSEPKDVSQEIGNLVYQLNACFEDPEVDKLRLVFVFLVDFLCIHPFSDGNGRTSRLLTSLLLLKGGHRIEEHRSLPPLILGTCPAYYEALEKSQAGWHEDKNDYSPFVVYMLERLAFAYEGFLAESTEA